ncbi:MAG: efflux RND transporter periplasmic adaptor subunit [Immundisolibacteraceae bacterium]|nr:efflux RND transporter periplasmic adaptor subunit [Immundisolibacteraceae bacterium]
MTVYKNQIVSLSLLALLTAGCSEKNEEKATGPRPVLVTMTEVVVGVTEELEGTVGRIESKAQPLVAAEIDGRITHIDAEIGDTVVIGDQLAQIDPEDYRLSQRSAQSDVDRINAMIKQQQRLVDRYLKLREDEFFAENTLDAASSELDVLKKQRSSALDRLSQAKRNLSRASVSAPLSGEISERLVNEGDYVKRGNPLFRLSTDQYLRVVLPYPESLADRLHPGLLVRLESATAVGTRIEVAVTEIRPTIGNFNHAVDVIVDMPNPGSWRPGGTINGELVMNRIENALLIPEPSVVLRPQGHVVYILNDALNSVEERLVETGVLSKDLLEVHSGLNAGDKVVVDGAGFLTGGAVVSVQQR